MKNEMKEIIICKHCGKPEYYGEMRWLNGFCGCRDCYKERYHEVYGEHYKWSDLDGKKPTIEDYNEQHDSSIF